MGVSLTGKKNKKKRFQKRETNVFSGPHNIPQLYKDSTKKNKKNK